MRPRPKATQPKRPKRQPSRVITFLTQDELRRLRAVIKHKRDRAIFLLAYRHGLRASELGLLAKSDLDLKRGRITVHRVKGSHSGIYPMQPDVVKTLRSHLKAQPPDISYVFTSNRGVPIDRRTLWWLMRKYGRAAGLPAEKLQFHVLKHSIATHLLDAGADISFVQDWLGHANIQNTRIYAQVTTTTREQNARRFFTSHHVV